MKELKNADLKGAEKTSSVEMINYFNQKFKKGIIEINNTDREQPTFTDDEITTLLSSFNTFITSYVNNQSTNGMLDPVKLKQSPIDLLNTFCPDEAASPPPIGVTLPPSVLYTKPPQTTTKPVLTTTKPVLTTTKPVLTTTKPVITTTKSKFGNMSGCSCTSWIFLLLLIAVVCGVMYYKNKKGNPFPNMQQRIAQFGREIKSIKKFKS
jgi:hypothetical protein